MNAWEVAVANPLAVLFALAVANVVGASALRPPDWSGTWTSRGEQDVEIVRMTPGSGTGRGWNGLVESLLTSEGYRILIAQADDQVAISFPGGSNNLLTMAETPFGPDSIVRVVDHGDFWTKDTRAAHARGDVLELSSESFSGWWRNGGPDDARPAGTPFRRRFVLERAAAPDELLLRVRVSDEKGELEYVQTFRRAP